jgi:hypothetical protein
MDQEYDLQKVSEIQKNRARMAKVLTGALK